MFRPAIIFVAALAAAASAHAADPSDADALDLADRAPLEVRRAQDWRLFAEAARLHVDRRGADPSIDATRASFDLLYDGSPMAGLRTVLSDRLDVTHSSTSPREDKVNTLREAYLSWQASSEEMVDIGRVNLRFGVASGYNPTDYFKAGALRSIVSAAPASLRENRLGTVVLQGQRVSSTGSLALAYSPRLARSPSTEAFSLDFGATNPRERWLLAASHKFGRAFSPQFLLHGGAGTPLQAGVNLSSLVGNATVAFGEFSFGRGPSLAARALDLAEAQHGHSRAALGFTTTTSFNLSLTAEAELNSAAPTRAQWVALRDGAPSNALRLLGTAQTLQDLPVRRALFVYASWQDALVKHLELSAFVRGDLVTHSRSQWLELRYHGERVEAAGQWQLNSGAPGSVFATVPQQRTVQLLLRVFL